MLDRATSVRKRGKSPDRKLGLRASPAPATWGDNDTDTKGDVGDMLALSPKARLEEEKKNLQKAQRTHERLLKKLEETSARTATKEARYNLLERDFQEKEAKFNSEYEKSNKEIARAREQMKVQMRKVEERLATKEQDWDTRESKKANVATATVRELREKIEQAKTKANDTEAALQLENSIRVLRDEVKELELKSRSVNATLEDKQDELKQERENIERTKTRLAELDENQVKFSEVKREKRQLERDFEDLDKDVKQKTKEMESNADEEDVWTLKGQLRDLKNKSDDLILRKEKMQTQIQRVQAGRASFELSQQSTTSTTSTSLAERVRTTSRDPPRTTATTRTTAAGTGRTSYLDRLGDKYQTGTTTTRRRGDDMTRTERDRIAELKKSKKEYETRSGTKVQELEKLKSQVGEATSAKEKTEALAKKLEEDTVQLQKLIKQEKELFAASVNALNQKIEINRKKHNTIISTHNNKLAKSKKDRQFELSEIQERAKKETDLLQERRTEQRKLETLLKQRERNIQRGDRDFLNEQKKLWTLQDKLIETQNTLASTRQLVDETNVEFDTTEKELMSEIHTLEREIYDQVESKEYLEQLCAELQKEVDDLNWYFMDHKKKNPKDSRIYGTREFDWVMHRRKAIDDELLKIDAHLSEISVTSKWKDKTLENLQKDLKKALKTKIDPDEVEDFNARLHELVRTMLSKQYTGLVTFQVCSLLAEEKVYPGILNYLKILTGEQEKMHTLDRPPMFINRVWRTWKDVVLKQDPEKTFRRELMERLKMLRVSYQLKEAKFKENFIQRVLDGEDVPNDELERWIEDAAEYFIFCGVEGSKEDILAEIRGAGDDEYFDEEDLEDGI